MGCLPLAVLWAIGAGAGYLLAGPPGAVWGAVGGLLVGGLATAALVRRLRSANRH